MLQQHFNGTRSIPFSITPCAVFDKGYGERSWWLIVRQPGRRNDATSRIRPVACNEKIVSDKREGYGGNDRRSHQSVLCGTQRITTLIVYSDWKPWRVSDIESSFTIVAPAAKRIEQSRLKRSSPKVMFASFVAKFGTNGSWKQCMIRGGRGGFVMLYFETKTQSCSLSVFTDIGGYICRIKFTLSILLRKRDTYVH